MSTTFACPSCGAELVFQSSISLLATCSFCQSMVVRRDMNLENLGKNSAVVEDMSVVQLGTRGIYRKNAFQVLGRVQMTWDGGYWNEWFVYFENGSSAWLAEAQGSLMMTFPDPRFKKFPRQEDLVLNGALQMSNLHYYYIKDLREATVTSTMGEIPQLQKPGDERFLADLSSEEGGFATLDYDLAGRQDPVCYLGTWETIQSLQLTDLREFEGWPIPSLRAHGS